MTDPWWMLHRRRHWLEFSNFGHLSSSHSLNLGVRPLLKFGFCQQMLTHDSMVKFITIWCVYICIQTWDCVLAYTTWDRVLAYTPSSAEYSKAMPCIWASYFAKFTYSVTWHICASSKIHRWLIASLQYSISGNPDGVSRNCKAIGVLLKYSI